ncbi:MAG: HIT family protein [Candidatus Aenigmarchaeota archaeon]|nr:HIT family protein [Candidatus Aenigmarchaeota archaeon]
MKKCPFCNKNNMKSHEILHEDDNHLVFFSKEPVTVGHTLVIPKKHIKSMLALTDKETDKLFELVKKTARIIHKTLKPNGLDIGTNYGRIAGQSIDHLHVHVIPRYKGDFTFLQIVGKNLSPYAKVLKGDEIKLVDKLRAAFA